MATTPTYYYLDADGDELIIDPSSSVPAVYITTDPDGVLIPLDEIPNLLERLREIAEHAKPKEH